MKKNELQAAFAQIRESSANDKQLHNSILERIENAEKSVIPLAGLKMLCRYFVVYLLVAYLLNLAVLSLLPAANIVAPDLMEQGKLEQIATGLELLQSSERLINLLIEGCFTLFFKISFLAFVFAAALMKAENAGLTTKGEASCAD